MKIKMNESLLFKCLRQCNPDYFDAILQTFKLVFNISLIRLILVHVLNDDQNSCIRIVKFLPKLLWEVKFNHSIKTYQAL